MSLAARSASSPTVPGPVPRPRLADIEIVIPVYNEERALGPCISRLRAYLDRSVPFPTVITVADNASTDRTWQIASALAAATPGVRAVHLDQKGRGRALREVWSASRADVVAYMDVDLSTDLDALLPLVAPLVSGHSDLAIGTRLARSARVVRGPKRELISRSYNLLVHTALHNGFSDAQCGFKAMRRDAADRLLPLVTDNEWFFDTELLVLAERHGLRIYEVPVDWVDDPDSRVHLASTVLGDLKGIWRLVRTFATQPGPAPAPGGRRRVDASELARFAGVGVVSTVVYAALFLVFRGLVGVVMANLVALALCTLGNTAAHGRITFGAERPVSWRTQLMGSAVVFLTTAVLTTAALGVARGVAGGDLWPQVVAIVAGTALAALVRFIVLKAWIFRTHSTNGGAPSPAETSHRS
jgi:putative flippase GtrA